MSHRLLRTAFTMAASLLATASLATAAPYFYVDWTSANPAAGTAQGSITLPDLSVMTVGFTATAPNGGPASFSFAQTAGGTDYWNPSTPFTSTQVDNRPPGSDILALVGGTDTTYTLTLSEAIKDPIMAIVSLGNPSTGITYDFDRPFTIVSQGAGFWGGGPNALQQLPGDVLYGAEGHGTIQFIGTFSTFSWKAPSFENWHGFTFGVRTTPRIEPPTVPEPASLVLLSVAGAGWALLRRRRSRNA